MANPHEPSGSDLFPPIVTETTVTVRAVDYFATREAVTTLKRDVLWIRWALGIAVVVVLGTLGTLIVKIIGG